MSRDLSHKMLYRSGWGAGGVVVVVVVGGGGGLGPPGENPCGAVNGRPGFHLTYPACSETPDTHHRVHIYSVPTSGQAHTHLCAHHLRPVNQNLSITNQPCVCHPLCPPAVPGARLMSSDPLLPEDPALRFFTEI